ncbi:MAG: hypothetical protein EXR79_05725 [Myxococcales bacterium]|nr:hypothetical protein [Myxococcales bacterium]
MSTRPADVDLFALYHLGVDRSGAYRFRNLDQCARELGVGSGQLQQWLQQAGLDAESVGQVPFDLAWWSAEAQFAAAGTVHDVVTRAWAALQQARPQRHAERFHHSIDYDRPLGDVGERAEQRRQERLAELSHRTDGDNEPV